MVYLTALSFDEYEIKLGVSQTSRTTLGRSFTPVPVMIVRKPFKCNVLSCVKPRLHHVIDFRLNRSQRNQFKKARPVTCSVSKRPLLPR
jgi:hypothetical protein